MRISSLRRHLPAGLALCTAFALSACSGGGSSPSTSSGSSTTAPRPSSTSAAGQGTSTSTAASGAAPSCSTVPASEVNSALGVNVGDPTSAVNGSVTTCTYNGTPGQVIVRFQTGENASTFAAGKAAFAKNGETTTDVSGVGDAAYSSSVGAGQFQTNTIVVLEGSLELLVTAPVTQEDVNALARQILLSV